MQWFYYGIATKYVLCYLLENLAILFIELRPKGRGRPQRILLGNWPEEHVRQVIRAVVFRDGTIPSYGNAEGGAEILPPTVSNNTSSDQILPPHPPSPSFEKRNVVNNTAANSSKSNMLNLGSLFSRGHSRSVSPPSNMTRQQRSGSFSPDNNESSNPLINHFDGISLATQLQQMYRQQLAAASQILAANKMAANAVMANNERGNDFTSAAFTAAAMQSMLAMDPAFKTFINEHDDVDDKFADADDANVEDTSNVDNDVNSPKTDDQDEEDTEVANNTNGGVSPPRFDQNDSPNKLKTISNETGEATSTPNSPKDLASEDTAFEIQNPTVKHVSTSDYGMFDCELKGATPSVFADKFKFGDLSSPVSISNKSTTFNKYPFDVFPRDVSKATNLINRKPFPNDESKSASATHLVDEAIISPTKHKHSGSPKLSTFASGEKVISPLPGPSDSSSSWSLPILDGNTVNHDNLVNRKELSKQTSNQHNNSGFEKNSTTTYQKVQ